MFGHLLAAVHAMSLHSGKHGRLQRSLVFRCTLHPDSMSCRSSDAPKSQKATNSNRAAAGLSPSQQAATSCEAHGVGPCFHSLLQGCHQTLTRMESFVASGEPAPNPAAAPCGSMPPRSSNCLEQNPPWCTHAPGTSSLLRSSSARLRSFAACVWVLGAKMLTLTVGRPTNQLKCKGSVHGASWIKGARRIGSGQGRIGSHESDQ